MGRRRFRRTRRSGFSLLEVALSITVVIVATHAAFHSAVQSADTMRTSRETETASADLRAAMEELLLLPTKDMPVEGSAFQQGVPIGAYQDLHLGNEALVATYPGYVAGQPVPDPMEIRLTLTWSDFAGRTRALSLATVKAR